MKREVYEEMIKRCELEIESVCYDMNIAFCRRESPDMGLAPGGLMRQEIFDDDNGLDAWDQENGLRCFVHLANSSVYQEITGHAPPHKPPTAKDYTKAGLPWFDYYSDRIALPGSDTLAKLTSVGAKMIQKGKGLLGDNEPVQPRIIRNLGTGNTVRDGEF